MKYLPSFIIFSILILCGSLASSAFRFSLRERAKQERFSKERISIDNDQLRKQFDHFFVPLAGTLTPSPGKNLTIEHVKGEIWGVRVDASVNRNPKKEPESEFSAVLINEGEVELNGRLHSPWLKQHLESAARSAVGALKVNSNLVVGTELKAPLWADQAPELLKSFLSFSGVKEIEMNSYCVRLEGAVLSPEVRQKLGEQAAEMIQVPAVLKNNLFVKRTINPTLQVYGTENEFKISGLFPDEETRRNLVALIQKTLPNQAFKDEIKIGEAVAAPWWLPSAESLIPMFLSETGGVGTLEYWKNRLRVTGQVSSDALEKALSSHSFGPEKPADFSVESELKLLPSIEPQINIFTDESGRFVMQGELGNPEFKNEILVALMSDRPDLIVVDQINVSEKVKDPKWGKPSLLISEVAFNIRGGTLKLSPTEVLIAGEVSSEEAQRKLTEFASAVVGTSAKIENHSTFPEEAPVLDLVPVLDQTPVETPLETATQVDESKVDFKGTEVYFDSGSSEVDKKFEDEIAKAAELIKNLNPGTQLTVGGFSDQNGKASTNRTLSITRANAVLEQLATLGIDRSRMKVESFIDDTSRSRRNLWKSRRVEISITHRE